MDLAGLIAGWATAERLHTLEGGGQVGELLIESFTIEEALSQPFTIRLAVLSLRRNFDLKALRLKRATLRTTLADGERVGRSGVVLGARRGHSGGGYERIELEIRPWIALLGYSSHSRVWQDKTLVQIVEDVFAPYATMGSWQWGEREEGSLDDFLSQGPNGGVHGYCVQYRETDLNFVQRLLANAGLNWRIEEDPQAPQGHRLVVFADSSLVPENATSRSPLGNRGIRFHAAGSQEQQDAIQSFGGVRALRQAATTQLGWDYHGKQAVAVQVPTHQRFAGDAVMAQAAWMERYEFQGHEADAGPASLDERMHVATLAREASEARNKVWVGRSTVRSLKAGERFAMTQGALDALLATGGDPADNEFVVLKVISFGINNLPRENNEEIASRWIATTDDDPFDVREDPAREAWTDDAALLEQVRSSGYVNRFEAVRRAIPWRPLPMTAATAGGLQTATVVGPAGNVRADGADEIHTDALGRIRLRFHWQGAPAADAREDNLTTCWVRVAQSWAGEGMGVQFIPRIGMEVSVVFLNGDINRPLVTGCLYNGRGEAGIPRTPGGQAATADRGALSGSHDARPSGQDNLVHSGSGGNAPALHGGAPGPADEGAEAQNNAAAMTGIKSKELGDAGFNQLVFDDTPEQLRTQFATTAFSTQLNLGHQVHQADNHRGSYRGSGFEIRTDAYGAIRAAKGLLLSSYVLDESQPAGDNAPGMAMMKQAAMLAEAFDKAAQAHLTTRLASHIGTVKGGQGALSDQEPPLKALQTALAGMVDAGDLVQAGADAAARKKTPDERNVPHTVDPVLAISARAGLGLVAGQAIQLASSEAITLQAGQDMNVAVGEQLRIQTGQSLGLLAGACKPGDGARGTGLTLINGRGPVDLQSQNGLIRIGARKAVTIQSANANIDWAAAKRIVLSTPQGASITIDANGIATQCPGQITVHAGTKSFVGPGKVDYALPSLPTGKFVCIDCLIKALHAGAPVAMV